MRDGRGRWIRTKPRVTRERRLCRERAWRRELRREVINALGGVCKCCGEVWFDFLTIDHVNDDGRVHRKRVGGVLAMLLDIKKQGYPAHLYRVLCYNCNLGRAFNYGTCPHEEGAW